MIIIAFTIITAIFFSFLIWGLISPSQQVNISHKKYPQLKERTGDYQLKRINQHRKKNHMQILHAYYDLDSIAKSHSYVLAKNTNCNHNGFELRAYQIKSKTGATYMAENCFKYPSTTYNEHTASKLVNGWMKSSGHRANLLNPIFSRIGIGVVVKNGYIYATQVLSN